MTRDEIGGFPTDEWPIQPQAVKGSKILCRRSSATGVVFGYERWLKRWRLPGTGVCGADDGMGHDEELPLRRR